MFRENFWEALTLGLKILILYWLRPHPHERKKNAQFLEKNTRFKEKNMVFRNTQHLSKQLQSYFPIAHGARKQLKDIIDQMEKYGIIRECDEPSLFVSNILVVDKKDKKQLRMLLDGRLLNQNTVRYPMSLIAQPELIAHFVKRNFFSNADLTDFFFDITA